MEKQEEEEGAKKWQKTTSMPADQQMTSNRASMKGNDHCRESMCLFE